MGTGLRRARRRRRRGRPDRPARRRAAGRADGRSTGRVLDGDGRPVRRQLVEVWQANAAGRYIHQRDQHPAPLDPHFTGMGRCLTDDDGVYRFTTIKPGPYPWRNHRNAWRPAHIHFSLFGTEFTQRMVTQMYFPGDPLFPLDPIYQSVVDPRGPGAAGRDLRPRPDPAGVVHRLPLGHRAHRPAPHPHGGERPVTPPRPRPARPSARSSATRCPFPGDSDAGPARYAGRGPAARPGLDGARRAGARRDPRALAGRRRRGTSSSSRARCAATAATFTGWGRASTDAEGRYAFTTVVPGCAVLRADGVRARPAQPAVHPRLPARGGRATPSSRGSTRTAARRC